MNTPIRRLAFILLAVLGLIILDLTYLQVIAGPRYRDDLRNPRVAADRSSTERGPIVTREGIVLAESTPDEDSAQTFTRSYPEGALYAHAVGYTTLLFGSAGLERSYAQDLSSDSDLTISGVIDALLGREQGAEGIRLTFSHPVQETARQALAGQTGAVVAIEPSTGEVLALYSSPSYDPSVLLGESAAGGDGLAVDPLTPLRDRTIDQILAPGSVFKVITAAAALEGGLANPDTLYDDPLELALPGSTAVIRNADRGTCGDGTRVDLATAFRRSCNTVFGQIGIDTGAETIAAVAEAFGFNDEIPFDLPVLASSFPGESLAGDPAATAQSAIGQRDVQATPLQMALVAAVVANDGVLMRPYVVSERFDRDLNILAQSDPLELRRAISPGTAAALSDMMQDVVESGTGRAAQIADAVVGGKTGTAEIPGSDPHAWFVGFAQVEDRTVAVAVVVENGGDAGDEATGGAVAAPIARAVMEAWLRS
ncbi:MAG: penicillin-binding protein 2 [Acidimicrobiia bacterium]|nr:penicillin-binding protein 2 [Acidimicrobiia bacterium]MBT8193868.1 penicillin-binding protein 2 [Acidimicrobiia bacterium]NNF87838.1 penicillin-binding protein 2 [Acidimicrobiia bacterium]NNL13730.1 penicillin-binding protein 2 [Acidimicrobiia bacterium]NNL97743.1 penicillin-binding protein 2 [Acidimicrobiia bacterium]